MKNIPDWIVKLLETENLYCNKCKKILRFENLISLGIQESTLSPHKDKLCIGLNCGECRETTIFELKEMNLLEFAFEILDEETEEKKQNKKDVLKELSHNKLEDKPEEKTTRRRSRSISEKKSRITKKEVNEVVRFLNSASTHEEFLVAMGLSPEQISKYGYKKSEEE